MIPAVLAARHIVGQLTFEENFSVAVGQRQDFCAAYPHLTTHYYFGDPKGLSSRDYAGTLSVMLDYPFDPESVNLQTVFGGLCILATPLTSAQAKKYPGNAFAAATVTTQNCFSQAYGYFEISAKQPQVPGCRTAFWLLPRDRSPDNGGRLAEIDVFECESGPIVGIVDRAQRPYSTIHYGVTGNEQKISNGQNLPPRITPGFHTYGFLWTPDTMTVFIDQVAVLTALNPGVCDPHYMVLSLDVMANQNPDPKLYPAPFIVDYIRGWALA
jgi:hypothetical protein